jgi:hypothetical protein
MMRPLHRCVSNEPAGSRRVFSMMENDCRSTEALRAVNSLAASIALKQGFN